MRHLFSYLSKTLLCMHLNFTLKDINLLIPIRILLNYWDIMGDSLDGSENTPETQNVVVVDFQDFANYMRRAATVLLPEDDIVPPALNAALDDKVNQDCIRKFITDPQVSSLYVQRFSSKGEVITTDRCAPFALLFLLQCSVHTLHLLLFLTF